MVEGPCAAFGYDCCPEAVLTIGLLDASVTAGTVQSSAVGPHHPEAELASGALFHAQLRPRGMALPNNLPP